MDDFSKKLATVIMMICAVVFVLQLYQKTPLLDALMFVVALAVAAIPTLCIQLTRIMIKK